MKKETTITPTTANQKQDYVIELAPGQGTILFLGSREDAAKVRQRHFSKNPVRPDGAIDRLLLGFLTGPRKEGWEYTDRMLKLFKDFEATTVLVYGGNMTGGEDSPGARFAAMAAKHGLLAILQPNDLYFRGHHFWKQPHLMKGLLKYKGPDEYMRTVLMPRLDKQAPRFEGIENVLAWAPVEEMPAEDEAVYAEYKKAFKKHFPNTFIFQIDSQQKTPELLASKQKPYPDILAFDRYPWWTRIPQGVWTLWTPDFAAKWLYNVINWYPKTAYELYQAPAVFVMQGTSELRWFSKEEGIKKGFKAEEGFRASHAPNISWDPKVGKFKYWGRYLPPTNAWRLQNWVGICAGYKGLMFWSAGPLGSEKELAKAEINGEYTRVTLIDNDLNTTDYLEEVAASWKDIRRFESLLLHMFPADIDAKVTCNDKKVFTNTFKDDKGNEYLIVVNADIGRWDRNNPTRLDYPNTQLTVEKGRLVNYTPLTTPRQIRLESGKLQIHDLRSFLGKCK